MAKMIPSFYDNSNGSIGEQMAFDALRNNLPDDYTVFHSHRWNTTNLFNRHIQGEADFIVFHPKHGILVIEVKSGSVLYENGLWYYEYNGKHTRMTDPMEQANKSTYFYRDTLNSLLHKKGAACSINSAVWFTSLDKYPQNMPLNYKSETTLLKSALTNTQAAIENAYESYSSGNYTKLSPESKELIITKLAPTINAMRSLATLCEEQDAIFVRLTNEQKELLDHFDSNRKMLIEGTAGTGKTMLAIEKAIRLAKNDKVLFLCFNSLLKDTLKANYRHHYNIEFHNLYTLVKKGSSKKIYKITDEDITQYLSHQLHNLMSANFTWKYKHIIIDEGQDFSDIHFKLLGTIIDKYKGEFYVFYDRYQNVHHQFNPQKWLEESTLYRYKLKVNCRNTRNIAMSAYEMVEIELTLKEQSPDGYNPELHFMKNLDCVKIVIEELINEYISGGISPKNIKILTIRTTDKSILYNTDRIGKWQLIKNRTSSKNKLLKEQGIEFTSARKFKGLESDVVILIDFDAVSENKEVFYVAASRARHFLDILSVPDTKSNIMKLIAEYDYLHLPVTVTFDSYINNDNKVYNNKLVSSEARK